MKINNLNIDTSAMPTTRVVKPFTVSGDIGAEFQVIVLQNPSSSSDHTLYYNWKNRSFSTGHNNLNNNLTVKLTSTTYNDRIIFEEGASGGGDYVVKLMVINGTQTSNPRVSVISRNISKLASKSTVTIQPKSLANSSNYQTLPTKAISAEAGSSSSVDIDFSCKNATGDAVSFGFDIRNFTVTQDMFFTTTTDTVNGAITSATEVVVDSLTNIGIGSYISAVSAGSLSGQPFITAINTTTNTLTLSVAQTFSDGITLTFIANGTEAINQATGMLINSSIEPEISVTGDRVSTQVRTAPSSSSTINITTTQGIGGGKRVEYSGLGVSATLGRNTVGIVTPDPDGTDGDGVMTVSSAQTLLVGTKLEFLGTSNTVRLSGSLNIDSFPSSDQTVHIDLDKITTPGVSGS